MFRHTDVNRMVLYLLVILMVSVSTIYFSICYLANGELVFTSNDMGAFFSYAISILALVAIVISSLHKNYYMEMLLYYTVRLLISSEGNLSEDQRDTQSMILELFKRLGVGDFEKKHRIL